MNTTTTETAPAITRGTRIMVVKGCNARGITKGITASVLDVIELGAEFGYSVKVTFKPLNGFKSGQVFAFYARHINRMADPIVSLNDGDPTHKIQISRKG